MKSVLISIRPEWCAKIASGEKTLEVRKNRPKLETPFKCYIYCTKSAGKFAIANTNGKPTESAGMIIGEFVCDRIELIVRVFKARYFGGFFEFVGEPPICRDKVKLLKESCLKEEELEDYLKNIEGYSWHISKLMMYDKPMRLNELIPSCHHYGDDAGCVLDRKWGCQYQENDYNPDGSINMVLCSKRVKKAPQSWCYVYEEGC